MIYCVAWRTKASDTVQTVHYCFDLQAHLEFESRLVPVFFLCAQIVGGRFVRVHHFPRTLSYRDTTCACEKTGGGKRAWCVWISAYMIADMKANRAATDKYEQNLWWVGVEV